MHNYINVVGKYSNGRYLPLTTKELSFTTTYGKFEGTELLIPWDYKVDSATITVTAIANKALTKTTTIYIKKEEEKELPTSPQTITITTPPKKTSTTPRKVKKKKSKG